MKFDSRDRKYARQYRYRVAGMAGAGAVIGGTGAAAAQIARVRSGELTVAEAARITTVEAAGTAAAAAAATAVMETSGIRNNFVRILGTIALATGAKYFINSATASLGHALGERRILAATARQQGQAAEPESTVEPGTTGEPKTTAKSETTAEPGTTDKSKRTAKSETTAEPGTTDEPKTTAKSETTAEPETVGDSKTTANPGTMCEAETTTDSEVAGESGTARDHETADAPEPIEKTGVSPADVSDTNEKKSHRPGPEANHGGNHERQ